MKDRIKESHKRHYKKNIKNALFVASRIAKRIHPITILVNMDNVEELKLCTAKAQQQTKFALMNALSATTPQKIGAVVKAFQKSALNRVYGIFSLRVTNMLPEDFFDKPDTLPFLFITTKIVTRTGVTTQIIDKIIM